MEYELTFRNLHPTWKVNTHLARSVVSEMLTQMQVIQASLSWTFVDAKRMDKVHWKFMQLRGSTDVITLQWAQNVRQNILYGDVFICIDDACENAKTFDCSFESEVFRYIVHSVLHLQGYDDIDPEDRKVMKYHENRWTHWADSRISDGFLIHLHDKC